MAADVDKIMRRHAQLKRKRSLLEQSWRECYDFTYPLRGAMFSVGAGGNMPTDEGAAHTYARAQNPKIFDGTATDCVRTLASGLCAGTTPSHSRWVAYGARGIDDDHLPDDAREWLDDGAQMIWKNIHASNFDAVHPECEIDTCVAGWFVMFIDEDPDEGGYVFEQWALSGVWAAASKPGGPLDTFHREVALTAEQAVNDYGEEMVSESTRGKASSAPDDQVIFVQAIYPRKDGTGKMQKNLPIASCHIERDSRKLVRESGYHEMPIVAPRWLLQPNSVYPMGPVWDTLPDIKQLNETIKLSTANREMSIAGMWIGEDDGVLNPRNLKVGPRKIIVANSVDSLKALEPPGDFQAAEVDIVRLQKAIRKALMADQLEPQEKGQRTATEVQVNVELIRQLLGPIYGRWLSEFVKPLLTRCFGLAYRAGVFGMPPDSLHMREPVVRFKGPLARAQQLTDVAAMDRYETTLGQEMQVRPNIVDNYDWDKAARRRHDLLGVPEDLKVDEDDMAETRKAQAEQAQQQQQLGTAATIAKLIGDAGIDQPAGAR